MRCKNTLVLIVALLLVFSFSLEAKTKKVRRVGVAPLLKVKGGIQNADMLKELVQKKSDIVKKGFENAGAAELYKPFMKKVLSAAIEEKVIPKGQHMDWMFFRAGKVIKDVEWAGKKVLEVFAITVQNDCKDYDLIIPKACGNVALIDQRNSIAECDMKVTPPKINIGEKVKIDMSGSKCATRYEIKMYHPEGTLIETKQLTAGNAIWEPTLKEPGWYFFKGEAFNADGIASKNTCEGKSYVNYPPVCDLKVEPKRGYVGQVFKLDASGSSDKDGKVVKADFTVSSNGQVVEEKAVTSVPFIWDSKFKKSAKYQIKVVVTDDFKAISSNNCEAEIEVQKRFYMLAEGGPMVAKGTYSGYIFARFGFAYLLMPEKLSLVASAGGALTLAGDPFKSHFLSNLLLNVHFSKMYLGGGIGFSSKVREGWKSDIDIVGNLGVEIFESFNKKGSIFAEIRVPMKKGLEFKYAHQFLLGFRFLF